MPLLKEHLVNIINRICRKGFLAPPPAPWCIGYSSISLSLIKMAPEKIRLVGPQALIQCWNF